MPSLLKGEFALDAVPTNHYAANSAWQQLSILAHNLTIGFQLHSNLATAKPSTAKRTYSYWLVSIKTLRFTVINRAARVARIHGRRILRFSHNPATQVLYDQVLDCFAGVIYSRFRASCLSSLPTFGRAAPHWNVVPASQRARARGADQRYVRYEADQRPVPLHGRAATRTPSGEMQTGVIANGPSCIFSFNHRRAIFTIG